VSCSSRQTLPFSIDSVSVIDITEGVTWESATNAIRISAEKNGNEGMVIRGDSDRDLIARLASNGSIAWQSDRCPTSGSPLRATDSAALFARITESAAEHCNFH
jgi:hypothetical protein